MLEQGALHLKAVAFEGAAPIGVGGTGAQLLEHLFHHFALKGVEDLFVESLFELDLGV